jgi:hypothetical protein
MIPLAIVRVPFLPMRKRAMTTAALPDAAVTDLSTLPLILMLDEISRIYRRAPGTVRRDLQAGTFRPAPFAKFPYRWLRDDIEEDLRRKSRQARVDELKPTISRRRRKR